MVTKTIKVELPAVIKDVWATQVANIAKLEEVEDKLAELESEKLTRAEYDKANGQLKSELSRLEQLLEEGENDLFVAVNNYIVEE